MNISSSNSPLSPEVGLIQSKKESLLKAPSPDRAEMLKQMADQILEKPAGIQTDVKQLAFLQTSAYLKGTSAEGGQIKDTLPFWKSMLSQWTRGKAILSPRLSPEAIKKMESAFKDIEDLDALTDNPEAFQKLVFEKLNEKGECYIPTGWRGSPGHFMIVKFSLKGQHIIAELMTKGGGAEFHPIIKAGPNRNKRDYRFNPIQFEKDFLENRGTTFFKNLLYFNKALTGMVADFGSEDLYALFLAHGTALPHDNNLAAGVTLQRSGTCTDTGLHMIVYEANPAEIKRNMMCAKFESLVQGYRQFKDSEVEAAYYLNKGAQEHLVRILKLYPEHMTEDEYYLSYAIATEIRNRTQKVLEAYEATLSRTLPDISSKEAAGEVYETIHARSPSKGDVTNKTESYPYNVHPNKPSEVIGLLNLFLNQGIEHYYDKYQDANKAAYLAAVHNVLAQLPSPTGELKDAFWDQIPEKDIAECLSVLSNVVQKIKNLDTCNNCILQLEAGLKAYDIACQLAPRLKELKLEGFSLPAPSGFPFHTSDPERALALEKIKANFKRREERQKKQIFPSTLFYANLSTSDHGKYMLQFLSAEKKQGLGSHWEEKLIESNSLLPKPYYDLQALVAWTYYQIQQLRYSKKGNDYYSFPNATFDGDLRTNAKVGNTSLQFLTREPDAHEKNPFYLHKPETVYFENGVYSTPLPELRFRDISEATMEELLLLKTEPSLQAIEALRWSGENLSLLTNTFIQGYLETVIFKESTLSQNLSDSPRETEARIQEFLHLAFNHYANSKQHLPTFLWLVKMGIRLEGYIKTFSKEQSRLEFPDYYAILQNMLTKIAVPSERVSLHGHSVLSFQHKDHLTKEDAVKLLSSQILLQMGDTKKDSQEPFQYQEYAIAYNKHHQFLITLIAELPDNERSAFLNQIIQAIAGKKVHYTWKKGVLKYANEDYELDLTTLTLKFKGKDLGSIGDRFTQSNAYEKVFGETPFNAILKDGFYYIQPDEKFKIAIAEHNRIKIYRELTHGNKTGWYEFNLVHTLAEKIPKPVKDYNVWTSAEMPPHILFLDLVTDIPKYYYDNQKGLRQCDDKGNPTDSQVLNIISPKEGSREAMWQNFLKYSDEPKNIIMTQNAKTLAIDKIVLSNLDIAFETVQGRLRSVQYPDYFLAENQDIPQLHRLKGALLLESADKKTKKVIIPAHGLKYGGDFPSGYMEMDPTKSFKTGSKPYFVYDIGENLKPDSPRAALFLSLIYRAQKDYKKALEYLHLSAHFANDQIEDLKMVELLIQNSKFPEACAFDCLLGLRMEEQRGKHTKAKFSSKPDEEESESIRRLQSYFREQFDGYLDRMSDAKEGVNIVDEALRLTPHQEKFYRLNRLQRKDVVAFHLTKNPVEHNMDDHTRYIKREGGYVRLSDSDRYLASNFSNFCHNARFFTGEELNQFKLELFYLYRSSKNLSERSQHKLKILLSIMQYPDLYRSGDFIQTYKQNFEGPHAKKIDFEIQQLPAAAAPQVVQSRPDTVKASYPQTAPPAIKLSLSVDNIQKPLGDLAAEFIVSTKHVPIASGEFPLKKLKIENEPPLVKRQIEDLEKGHEGNKKQFTPLFTMKGDLAPLKAKLNDKIAKNESRSKALKKEIEELANTHFSKHAQGLSGEELQRELDHLTRQKAGQFKRITIDILIAHLLKKDTAGLLKLNPALTDIETINNKLLELFAIEAECKQQIEARNTLAALETAKKEDIEPLKQKLGGILARERAYDPILHPEYLVYEFATGMLLRKDQVDLLDWIFTSFETKNLKNIMFQFAAGGGKTKVLLPIMAFYFSSRGFLPVGLNISSLYDIGKGDLDKSLAKAFKQNLELLEIELETPVSAQDLVKIQSDLGRFLAEKKCLAIKTETWHAIKLKYTQALETGTLEEIEGYWKIMEFLRTKGIALIDEGHQSEDPLHESNIASGKPTTLSPKEGKVVVALTKMMLEEPLKSLIRLKENKQALLTDKDMETVKGVLIERIIKDPQFHESKALPELLKEYFLSPPEQKPIWLVELRKNNPSLASTLATTKKFLNETAPHTLRLIQSINYGDSIHPGDLTAAPKHNKQPVTSKFQDIYVTLALTVQNTYQTGLSGDKVKLLLEILMNEHTQQKKALTDINRKTKAQLLLDKWWGGESPYFEQISLDHKGQMAEFAQKIGNHPEAIEQFLQRCALPQIKIYHEKINSTPPDLLDGFRKNITFSATPGLIELYPVEAGNPILGPPKPGEQPPGVRLDYGFEPQVLDMLCKPHNSGITPLTLDTLEQFFTDLDASAPGLIKNLCCMIDQGGIFRAFDNPKVVEALLAFAAKKGIQFYGGVYRKESHGLQESETGQLILKKGASDIPLKGSDLKEAVKTIGEDFDKILLATFFDRAITTGADLLQPLKGKGLLTIGEGAAKTHTIQAAMRLRQLLLGEMGQSVHWIIEKELLKQIGLEKPTVEELFLWMIKNEAALMEKAIVMRAFQGVQHLMRRQAWYLIDAPGLPPEFRKELYEKHKGGLKDKVENDPYETYGQQMRKEDTVKVLIEFAKNCLKDLAFPEDYLTRIPDEDKAALNLIIEQTKNLVPKINSSNNEMSQEMHQKQEVRQEQQALAKAEQGRPTHIVAKEEYDPSYHNVTKKEFLTPDFVSNKKKQHRQLKEWSELPFIPSDIIVSEPCLHVRGNVKTRELRPITYILVVQDGKEPPRYLLCSRRGASHYRKQLLGEALPQGRRAMLLNGDGRPVLNKGFQDFSLLESDPFKDRLTMIQFLNGKVKDFDRLKKLAREQWTREDYDKALSLIRSIHVGASPIDNASLESIRKFRKAKVIQDDISVDQKDIFTRLFRYLFPVKKMS